MTKSIILFSTFSGNIQALVIIYTEVSDNKKGFAMTFENLSGFALIIQVLFAESTAIV